VTTILHDWVDRERARKRTQRKSAVNLSEPDLMKIGRRLGELDRAALEIPPSLAVPEPTIERTPMTSIKFNAELRRLRPDHTRFPNCPIIVEREFHNLAFYKQSGVGTQFRALVSKVDDLTRD
jgi:hypothetical protein